jgi:hypothetical protein
LGTIAYHAAWDVSRGRLFGRIASNTCIVTFNQLVDLVMTQEPYRSAGRTFWIVDGGCAHHPNTFPARLQAMYPNTVAVPLPTHSSWLNQIEIIFSIVHRKVLTPMDVADEETLAKRVLDFQDYYQETAKPFGGRPRGDAVQRDLSRGQALAQHDERPGDHCHGRIRGAGAVWRSRL